MIKAGIKETRQKFTEYLKHVEGGEEIIVTKRNEPIAKIVSLKEKKRARLLSHKKMRSLISRKGKPLSEIVTDFRREDRTPSSSVPTRFF